MPVLGAKRQLFGSFRGVGFTPLTLQSFVGPSKQFVLVVGVVIETAVVIESRSHGSRTSMISVWGSMIVPSEATCSGTGIS